MKIELSYKKFIDGNHPKLKTCFNLMKSVFRKVQPKREKIQAQENTNPQKNKYKSEGAKQIQIPGVRMNH